MAARVAGEPGPPNHPPQSDRTTSQRAPTPPEMIRRPARRLLRQDKPAAAWSGKPVLAWQPIDASVAAGQQRVFPLVWHEESRPRSQRLIRRYVPPPPQEGKNKVQAPASCAIRHRPFGAD